MYLSLTISSCTKAIIQIIRISRDKRPAADRNKLLKVNSFSKKTLRQFSRDSKLSTIFFVSLRESVMVFLECVELSVF